jgi:hypothetical protein
MVVGTDADRDEISRDGTGATTGETTGAMTTVGEGTAGAITDRLIAVGGMVASATTASERSTCGIGGLTTGGGTLVSVITIGAIVMSVEFNIGIAGGSFVPFTGLESSEV